MDTTGLLFSRRVADIDRSRGVHAKADTVRPRMTKTEVLPYALAAPETDALALAPAKSTALTIKTIRSATDALRELRVEDAIEQYRQVLEVEPDNFYALAGIGIALTRVGLTDQALPVLHRASLMRPPSWEAFQILSAWTRYAERQAEGNFRRSTATTPPRIVVRILERLTGRTAAPDAGPLVPGMPASNAQRRL
jgi:Flp pilus assembly protein TadD